MDEATGIDITNEKGISLIAFQGDSISSVEAIVAASKRISDYLATTKPKLVVFDFAGVKFFSSQVLGLILDVRAKLKPLDGRVVISSIDPRLHRVFRITNLDRIFAFYPDKDTAVNALSTA
jgi:anti-sigma B factor antagonist